VLCTVQTSRGYAKVTRHIAFEEYLDLAPYCTRFASVGHFRNCYYRWSFACLLDWYSKHSLDDAQKIAKRNRNKNDTIFSLVFAHGVVDVFVFLSCCYICLFYVSAFSPLLSSSYSAAKYIQIEICQLRPHGLCLIIA